MIEDMKLNTNEYLPLRDVVFKTLREAILKGDLKPGERLMEIQLAQKLGVSRTPIREAIRMLELEGLTVTVPRKGAEVARMTLKDMEEVLEIRLELDEFAARLASKRMTEEQMEELYLCGQAFAEATKGKNVKEIAEADVRFHDVIYDATFNPRLVTLLNNLREQLYRYRMEYLKNETIYEQLIEEHNQIVEALKARDTERLVQVIHRHVTNQESAVKKVIQEQE